MSKPQILIVEAEDIVAMDLKRKLMARGYEIPALASSGQEAIQTAAKVRPDLALLDIKLKGAMDGIDAAEQIQTRLNIPIILMTAQADDVTFQRAKNIRPAGYLLKPFAEKDLHNTIELAFYRHDMERELRESEQRLATILNNIGDAVVATTAEGHITFMNPIAEALTGWTQAEALEQKLTTVFDIRDPKTGANIANPLAIGSETVDSALTCRTLMLVGKDGNNVAVEAKITPIKNEPGLVTGAVVTFRKISHRRQPEAKTRRCNRELMLFNRIISTSTAEPEPLQILETACRELALAFNLPQAAAILINRQAMIATVVAEYRAANGQPSLLPQTMVGLDAPCFQYFTTHQLPLELQDAAPADPLLKNQAEAGGQAYPVHPLYRQRGAVSVLLLPLMIEGELEGCLSLEATEARSFSKQEIDLAWKIVEQIGAVLARPRLNQAHRQLSTAIEQMAESIIITDPEGTIIYVNPAFEQVTGYCRAEVLGKNPRILNSGKQNDDFYKEMWATITGGQVWQGRFTNRKKDGTLFTEDATISPVRDEKGTIINYVGIKHDISQQLQLEEQYRQAQKMEAIGLLAGGIAHDFNNLLTAINGFGELTQMRLAPDNPAQKLVKNIVYSGQRAAELVGQLMTFSRKQVITTKILNLNQVVVQVDKMLRRIIGEHIQMETLLAAELWPIEADPSQIEQIIVNLAVNARDAMPGGGWLTLQTANALLDETYAASHLGVEPGRYVLLAISDTGLGMSDEVKSRIFEPFFTTKEAGKGTGLGLATVYGIVKQSGGHIWVYSEPGRGTTFKVYLPAAGKEASASPRHHQARTLLPGTETILVVEDEPAVRDLATLALRGAGYKVLAAENGQEGLRLLQETDSQVQLLLTDVIMPGMSGAELAEQVHKTHPDLKVVFMSGYADSIIAHHGVLNPGICFIEKPFSTQTLARVIRETLDGNRHNGAAS
ncbi:MAG: response regulator [Chloroflexota bacterium]